MVYGAVEELLQGWKTRLTRIGKVRTVYMFEIFCVQIGVSKNTCKMINYTFCEFSVNSCLSVSLNLNN